MFLKDLTPAMLSEWADIPVRQAHVLLNRPDGKTLSQAYLEANAVDARRILTECRHKVLGKGRRARRVTITASCQDELLREVSIHDKLL